MVPLYQSFLISMLLKSQESGIIFAPPTVKKINSGRVQKLIFSSAKYNAADG